MWESSNPALTNNNVLSQFGRNMLGSRSDVTTLAGVMNKTGILIALALLGGASGYSLVATIPDIMWISAVAAFVICLGVGFVLGGKPQLAPIVAPIYAIVEGLFLGSLTGALDRTLAGMGYNVAGGLALQALVITMGVALAMLGLYYARILRPSKTFTAVIYTATAGVMMIYLISFVLMIFGGPTLPFITLGSAFQGGTPALIGLGLNVAILGLASLWLVIDFKTVEDQVNAGAPKYMEWYCGFALLVTLAWIYYEAVKLAFRVAILLNSRD
jgi:uncharacterized YccA/Bax inhibitor family protein